MQVGKQHEAYVTEDRRALPLGRLEDRAVERADRISLPRLFISILNNFILNYCKVT